MKRPPSVLLLLSLGLLSCAPKRIVLLPTPPPEVRKEAVPAAAAPESTPGPQPTIPPPPAAPAPPPVDYAKRYEEAIVRTREAIERRAWRKAIPDWGKLEKSPYRRDALFHQGVLLQLAGDLDGAETIYRTLAEESPAFEPAAANLLGILLLRGDMEESGRLAARLLPDPASPAPGMLAELQANLAAVLVEQGNRERAARLFLSLRNRGIDFPSLTWNLAVLAFRRGDVAAARELSGRLPEETASLLPVAASRAAWDPEEVPTIEHIPSTGRRMEILARNLRAFREHRKGDPGAAEAILRETNDGELPPELLTNLGILAAEQGKWKEARESFEEAVRKDPTLASGWRNLGIFLEIFAGDPEGARECYERYGINNGVHREEVLQWAEWLERSVPSSP